jgi:preprotein translocase subunit SecD
MIRKGRVPPGDEILDQAEAPGENRSPLAVHKEIILSGDRIDRASNAVEEHSGEPIVTIVLDQRGKETFADITRENIHRRLAIVLGKKILSAPMIQMPILGGEIEISGDFTSEAAANLAVQLSRGALPAPFRVLELHVMRGPK